MPGTPERVARVQEGVRRSDAGEDGKPWAMRIAELDDGDVIEVEEPNFVDQLLGACGCVI